MNNFIKENWFKFIVAILLFWAIADNPYSYYQFLRWVVLIIGSYSAYLSYKNNRIVWVWLFGIIVILFNPIVPFYLSKETWQLFDIVSGILFLASLRKIKHEKH